MVAFAIRGPIARADLPGLCERVCVLLNRNGGDRVLCDVAGVEPRSEERRVGKECRL